LETHVKAALLGLLLLGGCATLSDERVFHTCRALDTVSTIVILQHGGTELNPILAAVIHSGGYPALIVAEVGISYAVHKWWPGGSDGDHKLVNAVSCLPVPFNARSL
jgi:hypothetical protein